MPVGGSSGGSVGGSIIGGGMGSMGLGLSAAHSQHLAQQLQRNQRHDADASSSLITGGAGGGDDGELDHDDDDDDDGDDEHADSAASAAAWRPWYVDIHVVRGVHARRSLLRIASSLHSTRKWAARAGHLAAANQTNAAARHADDIQQLQYCHSAIQLQQEQKWLGMEAIAAIADIDERKRAKKQRQQSLCMSDHIQRNRMHARNQLILEQLWRRAHQQQENIEKQFLFTWHVINAFGKKLSAQAALATKQAATQHISSIMKLRETL